MRDSVLKRRLVCIYETVYSVVHESCRVLNLRINYRLRIMNTADTIRYIKKHRCSIARYGDGEFSFALKSRHLISFQSNSEELSERLCEVLRTTNDNLLICVPRFLNTFYGCTDECKKYWRNWGKKDDKQKRIVLALRSYRRGSSYLYGNTQITRPYIDYKNKRQAIRVFRMLKSIWDDKTILIVEGEQTRLGIGNDLFANTKSIKRILAPAVNAFDCYDRIIEAVIRNFDGDMVLLALGPTATVMAADLSKKGIQALDIGHIDIEYEWMKQGATSKVAIKGKYTNEVVDGRNAEACEDAEYLSQIVDVIKPCN